MTGFLEWIKIAALIEKETREVSILERDRMLRDKMVRDKNHAISH